MSKRILLIFLYSGVLSSFQLVMQHQEIGKQSLWAWGAEPQRDLGSVGGVRGERDETNLGVNLHRASGLCWRN